MTFALECDARKMMSYFYDPLVRSSEIRDELSSPYKKQLKSDGGAIIIRASTGK